MICDVAKYQGLIDWAKLAPSLDFVIIKASGKEKDPYCDRNIAGAKKYGVPWHAYHFLYCTTVGRAEQEARLFVNSVGNNKPLFWVLDCEDQWGVKDANAPKIVDAFVAELKRLVGDVKVAIYVAQNKYHDWKIDYSKFAYVWIPGYGEKYKPQMPCDMWQYTSKGTAPGINGNVDLNKLMGTKPMSFFIGETTDEDRGESNMFTGKQLAEYCEKVYAHKDHWAYWYGTYGKKCSMSIYEHKKKQYPSHYTSDRKSGYMKDIEKGRRCADCVGLIKSFFWTGNHYDTDPKYASNNCPDKSANGMIAICKKTGNIKSIPDIPGLVVWKTGHIGVYVGGGYTVEMKGFAYDCVRNKVEKGPWTKWGMLPDSMISYTDKPIEPVNPEPVGDRELKYGDEGEDVKQLQENLIQLGYDCGIWGADGEFGDCTELALEHFQQDYDVPVTGVYDAETRAAMEKALDAQDEPVDEPKMVQIVGGNCYVRSAPNTGGKKLGVAHKGETYKYQGETSDNGWHLIDYKNNNGWVSGKYSKLVD